MCKEEGIALGKQGKEHLRDMSRIRLQHKVEGSKQYLVKISSSSLEMRQIGTGNMGTSPRNLHHPQVTLDATGNRSALPEQLFTLKHCTVHCGISATNRQAFSWALRPVVFSALVLRSAQQLVSIRRNTHTMIKRKVRGKPAREHKDLASVHATRRYQN